MCIYQFFTYLRDTFLNKHKTVPNFAKLFVYITAKGNILYFSVSFFVLNHVLLTA